MAENTQIGEPSGVWYCRIHSGIVNEDERHDEDDQCPWHEHDDKVCPDPEHDPDPNYDWCEGDCSPCLWVELLVPPPLASSGSPAPEGDDR